MGIMMRLSGNAAPAESKGSIVFPRARKKQLAERKKRARKAERESRRLNRK